MAYDARGETAQESDPMQTRPGTLSSTLAGFTLFATLLAIFWLSPVIQVTDAKFGLLVSHNLLHRRTFTLDHFAFPKSDIGVHATGVLYQLHEANGHVYYIMPQGSSILSAPFVGLAETFGLTPVNPDGSYNEKQEARLQHALAAFLMAALGWLFYCAARLLLPVPASLAVALGGSLGTQIWSTASRGMWAHTWNSLLWGLVAWLLLRAAARETKPQPVLLATILSWAYFTRPTSAVGIIAVSVYVLWFYRAALVPYAATGGAWLALFLYWSRSHFGAFFPEYYQAGRLDFSVFGTALAGHLISPGRGLLVYVPASLFVVYLLARRWRELPHKALAVLALACIGGQLFTASAYPHWWGGNSFGPRFLTDLTPWLVLLAILCLAAQRRRRVELAAGLLLLALSIFINGRGALSWQTWYWNSVPDNINTNPHRLWDWRQPQFMAGLLRPPLPAKVPPNTRIDFTQNAATPFLWYGWSGPEPSARWSDGTEAAVVFNAEPTDAMLEINLGAFIVPGRLAEQTVTLELNGQTLDTLRLSTDNMETYTFRLRPEWLAATPDVLRFHIPQAAAPAAFTDTPEEGDQRLLGVRVDWLEIKK
jgi:hypothetical protein